MSAATPTVGHVCPRCRESFSAPLSLADTYCPECFGEAFGIPTESETIPAGTLWQWHLPVGIMCLTGAFLVALWVVLR